MTTQSWHEGSASIVILPGGVDGEAFLDVVEEWTSCWMLKPAFWVTSETVSQQQGEQARVTATVVARNGRKSVDLLQFLSGVDLRQVRLIALRTVEQDSSHDQAQDAVIDIIADVLNRARPYNLLSHGESAEQTHLFKINLVFAPTLRKGASFTHLLEPSWDMNLVIAPEDRSTPSRFDKSTRDSSAEDHATWTRFLVSNAAVVGGLWAGQNKSVMEVASQFADLSPIQGQVRVLRTFVRGILSEGISTKIAAEALSRAANVDTSALDPLRPFPNPHLEPYEGERISAVIEEMVAQTFEFSKGRLKYKDVTLEPPPSQEETGVVAALKYFFKATWNLLKVLPLWFFAAIWNRIARLFSRLIFGAKGRRRVVGAIDFPRTALDKDAEADLIEIQRLRDAVKDVVANWPSNVIRKSEPILWSDIRRLIFGRLDGSALPSHITHESGTVGKLVIGDVNYLIPNVDLMWELPSGIERTTDLDARSVGWRNEEGLAEMSAFLDETLAKIESELNELGLHSQTLSEEKLAKSEVLKSALEQLAELEKDAPSHSFTTVEEVVGS